MLQIDLIDAIFLNVMHIDASAPNTAIPLIFKLSRRKNLILIHD